MQALTLDHPQPSKGSDPLTAGGVLRASRHARAGAGSAPASARSSRRRAGGDRGRLGKGSTWSTLARGQARAQRPRRGRRPPRRRRGLPSRRPAPRPRAAAAPRTRPAPASERDGASGDHVVGAGALAAAHSSARAGTARALAIPAAAASRSIRSALRRGGLDQVDLRVGQRDRQRQPGEPGTRARCPRSGSGRAQLRDLEPGQGRRATWRRASGSLDGRGGGSSAASGPAGREAIDRAGWKLIAVPITATVRVKRRQRARADGRDDQPALGLVALAVGLDVGAVAQVHVHDLALRGRHRLELHRRGRTRARPRRPGRRRAAARPRGARGSRRRRPRPACARPSAPEGDPRRQVLERVDRRPCLPISSPRSSPLTVARISSSSSSTSTLDLEAQAPGPRASTSCADPLGGLLRQLVGVCLRQASTSTSRATRARRLVVALARAPRTRTSSACRPGNSRLQLLDRGPLGLADGSPRPRRSEPRPRPARGRSRQAQASSAAPVAGPERLLLLARVRRLARLRRPSARLAASPFAGGAGAAAFCRRPRPSPPRLAARRARHRRRRPRAAPASG